MPSKETKQEMRSRAKKILAHLRKKYPDPKIALDFSNPLQLLIATILSAQCTDKRVNMVTPGLFKKYRSAYDFSIANLAELERDIRSTGFYRNKAKSIVSSCKSLVEKHGGNVPKTMDELIQLGGVGRKTANCVLGGAYGINSGVVVDTHVRRVSQRLGLATMNDPEKIELELMGLLPQNDWFLFGNLLIWHGRETCDARKPDCLNCPLQRLCPSAEEFIRTNK